VRSFYLVCDKRKEWAALCGKRSKRGSCELEPADASWAFCVRISHTLQRLPEGACVDGVPPHKNVEVKKIPPSRIDVAPGECSDDLFREHHLQSAR
jgi:hypothetical protein